MFFKETSLDPNVAVSPEKHLFSTCSCKPQHFRNKIYKDLHRFFVERKFYLETRNKYKYFSCPCALKYLSKEMLFASIGPFREMTFKQVRNSSLQGWIQTSATSFQKLVRIVKKLKKKKKPESHARKSQPLDANSSQVFN